MNTMTKSELLNLPKGLYLLTDNICNYNYILTKFEHETLVGKICDTLSYTSILTNGLSIHYSKIEYFEENYDRDFPNKKQFTFRASIGGLSVREKGYNSDFNGMQLIGKYNRESLSKDIKNFKLHYKIGLNKYDRKRLRK